jgi:hypothetical protein
MVESDDIVSIQHHVRELTESALGAARERANCDAAVKKARETLEAAQRELPEAEREAKERRQAQNDAIRGRAELEHRLAELIEAEDLTRARRQQAEQRSQGFRAASAFASAGRAEAELAGDTERVERERLVEERANREASAAEARAAEELAEETKISRHRSEIETHVEAERALEAEIAADRASGEAHVSALKETIENASFELHEAEVNLARLDADRERLAQERAIAGERLREIGQRARGEIETRIGELRAQEIELARRREEQEVLLASLTAPEEPLVPEPEPEPEPEIVQVEDTAGTSHASSDASDSTTVAPPPEPHFSTVTFKTTVAGRETPAQRPADPNGAYDDDRNAPDFRSLIGNIFTRRKPVEEPVEDEGPSIADRIARDFGLLGAEEAEAAVAAAKPDTKADSTVPAAEQAELHLDPTPRAQDERETVSLGSRPEGLHADEAEHA